MHNAPTSTRTTLNRRELLLATAAGAAVLTLGGLPGSTRAAAPVVLPPLPWADSALAPVISANTISFHYGKHHQGYVTNLNKLTAGTPMADQSLEQIVRATAGKADQAAIFNNAAQVWNHTFYWQSLKPGGGGEPPAALNAKMEASFGSVAACREELTKAATSQFGSGWAWLVAGAGGKLAVESSGNQDSPLMNGNTPILGLDVWEHAYYLRYQNRRPEYINAFYNVINWPEVARRYQAAIG